MLRKIFFSLLIINAVFKGINYSQTISNSYPVNLQIPIGGSEKYYVPISGTPANAIITNVQAKFEYQAFNGVQNYVSARFNRGSDPGSSGGVVLVSQGNLPSGNPVGSYGYISYNNWNGQSVNANYYFRFSVASGSAYAPTIKTIYVIITYSVPQPDIVALNSYITLLGNPAQEMTRDPNMGEQIQFGFDFRIDNANVNGTFRIRGYLDNLFLWETNCTNKPTGNYYLAPSDIGQTWTAIAGSHNYRCVVDVNNAVSESNENNNENTRSWNTAQQFDLEKGSIDLKDKNGNSIPQIYLGDEVYFYFHYTVNGSGTTPAFKILCKLDGNTYETKSNVTGVGGQSYDIHTTNPWVATAGSHNMEWILDSDNAINESNENNNSSATGATIFTKSITLDSPINNQSINTNEVKFTWSGATATRYVLYVDDDINLTSPEVSNNYPLHEFDNYSQTDYTLSGNSLEPGKPYYWKVKAYMPDNSVIESNVGTFYYNPPKAASPVWVPIYRMFKPSIHDHYYCTSDNHRQIALKSGYKDERVDGYLSIQNFNAPNMVPIFRFYDGTKKCHYYTSSETDKDVQIQAGLLYEGIIGYAYSTTHEGLSPLYHLRKIYSSSDHDHFYTISTFEKDNAISTWQFDNLGITAYISRTGEDTQIPVNESQFLAGDGVNVVNGNFSHYEKNSFEIPGIGVPLVFAHIYNSLGIALKSTNLPLGPGWTHSYHAYIDFTYGGNQVAVVWPEGRIDLYNKSGDTYTPVNKGVNDELTHVSSNDYQIKTKDQIRYTFTIEAGLQDTLPAMLSLIRDRNGNMTSLAYEATGLHRLTGIWDPSGRQLVFDYHTTKGLERCIRQITAPLNRSITFAYDTTGVLVSFTNVMNKKTDYIYDETSTWGHLLKKIKLPNGNEIDNTYEAKKIRSQSTNGAGTVTVDPPVGNQITVTNAKGLRLYITKQTSGGFEVINKVQDGIGNNANMEFNDSNNPTKPTKTIDQNLNTITYSYDAKGNVLQINQPSGVVHQYTYDAMNNVTQYLDPNNHHTNYAYDGNGNLTSIQNHLGSTTTINRQPNGLISSVSNPLSHSVNYTYDSYGNPTAIQDPLSHMTYVAYDLASRVLQVTNPKSQTTRYSYFNNDLTRDISDPANGKTTYGYDDNGNLTFITNPKNQQTTWGYNDQDWMTSISNPLGNQTVYSYNSDGSLSGKQTPIGASASYSYDAAGRLTGISSLNATFTYDGNGNVKNATDGYGSVSFNYDGLNRLSDYMDFYNYTVGYGYDPASNITRITYPTYSGNKNITCSYYTDNRLHTVTDWNGKTTEYFYRADGSIQQINYPNGTYTAYSYDNADRLTGIAHRKSGGEVIASFTYTLDEIGNITNEDRTIPLEVSGYSPMNISLGYDNANRIQSAGSSSFTLNANGNITSQTGGRNLTFTFDTENRLTGISGDQSASNIYDTFGNRRQVTRNGTTTRYVLDVNGSMSKVLIEKDSNGNDLYYYVYGVGLIYRIKANGTYEYYHCNNVGSTIAITNASQNITHKYAYDPFGKVMNSQEADYNPYRFVGQFGVMDEGNGLNFMRARFYDADMGRFVSEDPVWGVNLYSYAEGNPLLQIDPKGLFANIGFTLYMYVGIKIGSYGLKKTFRLLDKAVDYSFQKVTGKKPMYQTDYRYVDLGVDLGELVYSTYTKGIQKPPPNADLGNAIYNFISWLKTAKKVDNSYNLLKNSSSW